MLLSFIHKFMHFLSDIAKEALRQALELNSESSKCMQLQTKIDKFSNVLLKAEEAYTKGEFNPAVKYYTDCLASGPSYKIYSSILYYKRAASMQSNYLTLVT